MIRLASIDDAPGVRHGFFTREGGVSGGIYDSLNGGLGSNDDPAHVTENRRRMAEEMGVAPECLLSAHQIHSPDVVVVTGPWQGDKPRADALVTSTEGIAIGVTAADCGPVLFADASARVIGAAHAGWKGALTGVVESTIAAMEKLGADRSDIVAAIGPQSAAVTPMAIPSVRVTSASARGLSPCHGPLATTTSGEWIWCALSRRSGATPIRSAIRRRFSATRAGSSSEPSPPLRLW